MNEGIAISGTLKIPKQEFWNTSMKDIIKNHGLDAGWLHIENVKNISMTQEYVCIEFK
ncbi:MAG: hypothetical protein GX660_02775 [Clostridiaceae bacterium]|jgi:hypothetical protein|nr:hypothetical protein [Clostridiaceae bacterium]